MKIRHIAHLGLVVVLALFTMPQLSIAADDIDDVEADMESALSESEAAQSEAQDAKKREGVERENLKKDKSAAQQAVTKAKARESTAKNEINILAGKITAAQKERQKHQKIKADAEKRIAVLDQQVADKKLVFDKSTAEKDAAKAEKEAQQAILSQKVKEKQELESSIVKAKEDAKELTAEIATLKTTQTQMEKNLVRLRESARKEAARKDKLAADKEALKRKVSNIPKKVLLRKPKIDCEVTETAGDGALSVGQIKKGVNYEVYRLVNKRWVEVRYGGAKHGFAPKTCF